MNRHRIHPPRCPKREQGTTLIEALVAVVILSVGLLGMAGLQANALKLNQHSLQRSQASILAYDMLDLLRSDPARARTGDYDLNDDPGSNAELVNWRNRITAMLGSSATGQICRVTSADDSACSAPAPAASNFFRISVNWNEAEQAASAVAGGNQTFTLVGSL